MKQLKKQFNLIGIIICLIGVIITIAIGFYSNNHNNLKEHINLKSEHLEKNIKDFKQETKNNFDKIDKKLDELDDKKINKNNKEI
ncbi:hypothetical protein [Candidatus Phytoplasma australiense]|uniref:Uncharacterized protein n=1 Tax=Strawberry lethal yellows phytoplasma (CPA) str. NZSb11 TaxID=980422 RepID=R4RYB8_PHYAS|nr:hypothetical protein [Candidatus Phytoplasma australiense]AGL90912.1 Hypothetical Protein SLY_0998 [Strawberry lethal yellows phytoplasma (CPA) str. NZSb11]